MLVSSVHSGLKGIGELEMPFELSAGTNSDSLSQKEAEALVLPDLAVLKSPALEQQNIAEPKVQRSAASDWFGDLFNRGDKSVPKKEFTGIRDGSSKAILGVAAEKQEEELYAKNYMSITEQGRLACAVSVSSVYKEAGLKTKDGKAFPIRVRTVDIREDLIRAGWKVVEGSPSPGDFVETFGAYDGSGAHHSMIVGPKAMRGQKHPVSGEHYPAGETMAYNNNNRTRKSEDGSIPRKWWGLESLSEATSEYKGNFALRPPEKGEKYDPEAERRKVRTILRSK